MRRRTKPAGACVGRRWPMLRRKHARGMTKQAVAARAESPAFGAFRRTARRSVRKPRPARTGAERGSDTGCQRYVTISDGRRPSGQGALLSAIRAFAQGRPAPAATKRFVARRCRSSMASRPSKAGARPRGTVRDARVVERTHPRRRRIESACFRLAFGQRLCYESGDNGMGHVPAMLDHEGQNALNRYRVNPGDWPGSAPGVLRFHGAAWRTREVPTLFVGFKRNAFDRHYGGDMPAFQSETRLASADRVLLLPGFALSPRRLRPPTSPFHA